MRRGETTRTGRAMLPYADKLRSGAASGHVLERPAKDRQTKLVYREVQKAANTSARDNSLWTWFLNFCRGLLTASHISSQVNPPSRSQLKWMLIPFDDRVKTKKKPKKLTRLVVANGQIRKPLSSSVNTLCEGGPREGHPPQSLGSKKAFWI